MPVPKKPFAFYIEPEPNTGCHIWVGGRKKTGYGNWWNAGKNVLAHRSAYETEYGSIPTGMTIDHLCNIRWCVNPKHMCVATQQENMRRGNCVSAIAARKTACKEGHPFTQGTRQRVCRVCANRANQAYKIRRKLTKEATP